MYFCIPNCYFVIPRSLNVRLRLFPSNARFSFVFVCCVVGKKDGKPPCCVAFVFLLCVSSRCQAGSAHSLRNGVKNIPVTRSHKRHSRCDTTATTKQAQPTTKTQESVTASPGESLRDIAKRTMPDNKPPLIPTTDTSGHTARGSFSARQEDFADRTNRFASYASGASTPELHSSSSTDEDDNSGSYSDRRASNTNPKTLSHSASAIGLDEMIEDRREAGDLRQNVVHIEVPFGKPIEEVCF